MVKIHKVVFNLKKQVNCNLAQVDRLRTISKVASIFFSKSKKFQRRISYLASTFLIKSAKKNTQLWNNVGIYILTVMVVFLYIPDITGNSFDRLVHKSSHIQLHINI